MIRCISVAVAFQHKRISDKLKIRNETKVPGYSIDQGSGTFLSLIMINVIIVIE